MQPRELVARVRAILRRTNSDLLAVDSRERSVESVHGGALTIMPGKPRGC